MIEAKEQHLLQSLDLAIITVLSLNLCERLRVHVPAGNFYAKSLSLFSMAFISMSDPLLKIANHHAAACGDPPIIDASADNCYVGYFENPYGEQWIFTLDRATGKATLRGGDVGWNMQFDVTNGTVADLTLGHEEQLWLQACWSSARKQVRRD